MTTLTSSATLTIGDASTAAVSVSLLVIPAIGSATGRGRLVHPSLGTYDYPNAPDDWVNIDGDVIIPPIWASSKTLKGSANTLFVGDIRDVTCEEHWTQPISARMEHLRMLLSMFSNPPDPSVAYVTWYPNYTSAYGFKVILLDLTVGGSNITLNSMSALGWAQGNIVLKLKIAGRV
jgi:hypothetical protein